MSQIITTPQSAVPQILSDSTCNGRSPSPLDTSIVGIDTIAN